LPRIVCFLEFRWYLVCPLLYQCRSLCMRKLAVDFPFFGQKRFFLEALLFLNIPPRLEEGWFEGQHPFFEVITSLMRSDLAHEPFMCLVRIGGNMFLSLLLCL